jgi:endonuclease IV
MIVNQTAVLVKDRRLNFYLRSIKTGNGEQSSEIVSLFTAGAGEENGQKFGDLRKIISGCDQAN